MRSLSEILALLFIICFGMGLVLLLLTGPTLLLGYGIFKLL